MTTAAAAASEIIPAAMNGRWFASREHAQRELSEEMLCAAEAAGSLEVMKNGAIIISWLEDEQRRLIQEWAWRTFRAKSQKPLEVRFGHRLMILTELSVRMGFSRFSLRLRRIMQMEQYASVIEAYQKVLDSVPRPKTPDGDYLAFGRALYNTDHRPPTSDREFDLVCQEISREIPVILRRLEDEWIGIVIPSFLASAPTQPWAETPSTGRLVEALITIRGKRFTSIGEMTSAIAEALGSRGVRLEPGFSETLLYKSLLDSGALSPASFDHHNLRLELDEKLFEPRWKALI